MRNYIIKYFIKAFEYVLHLLKNKKKCKMDVTYLITSIIKEKVCPNLDSNQYTTVEVNNEGNLKSLIYIFNFKNLKDIVVRIEYINGVVDFQFVSTSFIELDILSNQLQIINESLNGCKKELLANFKLYDDLA